MKGNFPACVDFTLTQEGGLCDAPGDPGGCTNFGISQRAYPALDILNLTRTQAVAIYERDYWQPVNGDGLPPGVDLLVFDFGVNSGVGTSARRLQALVGVTQDGEIGPATLAAIATHDPKWVVTMLSYAHTVYYRALPGFGEFGAGWLARVERAKVAALGMVAAG